MSVGQVSSKEVVRIRCHRLNASLGCRLEPVTANERVPVSDKLLSVWPSRGRARFLQYCKPVSRLAGLAMQSIVCKHDTLLKDSRGEFKIAGSFSPVGQAKRSAA